MNAELVIPDYSKLLESLVNMSYADRLSNEDQDVISAAWLAILTQKYLLDRL